MLKAIRTIWDSFASGLGTQRNVMADTVGKQFDLLFMHIPIPGVVDIVAEYAQEFKGVNVESFVCDQDINDVIALPENKLVVCDDLTVRIMDLQRHREQVLFSNDIHPFTRFTCSITLAVLGNDMLAVGENTGDIHVWNVKTGDHVQSLVGHTGATSALAAMSADRLVSASDDTTLRIWVVSSGDCIQTLRGHTDLVVCVAVINDAVIASGSWDENVRVWDVISGECLHICAGHTEWVGTLVLIRQNVIASGSGDSSVRVWDLMTGGCMVLDGHSDAVSKLIVLKDGTLVSGSADKTLCVWDTVTGERIRTLVGHTDGVHSMAILTNGKLVSASNSLIIWE